MFEMGYFLNMIRQGKNPEQIMMNVLQTQMGGTPVGDNLIQLARKGDYQGIEKVARNLAQQQGIDFDKEFAAFQQRFGF